MRMRRVGPSNPEGDALAVKARRQVLALSQTRFFGTAYDRLIIEALQRKLSNTNGIVVRSAPDGVTVSFPYGSARDTVHVLAPEQTAAATPRINLRPRKEIRLWAYSDVIRADYWSGLLGAETLVGADTGVGIGVAGEAEGASANIVASVIAGFLRSISVAVLSGSGGLTSPSYVESIAELFAEGGTLGGDSAADIDCIGGVIDESVGVNIFPNPGFEDSDIVDWDVTANFCRRLGAAARTDSYGVEMYGSGASMSSEIETAANTDHILSMWFNFNSIQYYTTVHIGTPGDPDAYYASSLLPTDENIWEKFTAIFTTGTGTTTRITLTNYVGLSTQSTYLDDFSLTEA